MLSNFQFKGIESGILTSYEKDIESRILTSYLNAAGAVRKDIDGNLLSFVTGLCCHLTEYYNHNGTLEQWVNRIGASLVDRESDKNQFLYKLHDSINHLKENAKDTQTLLSLMQDAPPHPSADTTHVNALKKTIEDLHQQNQILQEEIKNLSESSSYKGRVKFDQEKIQELEEQVKFAEQQIEFDQEKIKGLEGRVKFDQEKIQELEEQIKSAEQQIEFDQEKIKGLEGRVKFDQEKIQELEEQIKSAEQQIEFDKQKTKELQEEVGCFNESINDLNQQILALEAEKKALAHEQGERSMQDFHGQMQNLQCKLESKEKEHKESEEALIDQVAKQEEKIRYYDDLLGQLNKKIISLEFQNENLQTRIDGYNDIIEQLHGLKVAGGHADLHSDMPLE